MEDVRKQPFFEPAAIDYRLLGEALEFYDKKGYAYREVPWVVSHEAMAVTLPPGAEATHTQYGDLVGSAEQGFIELMIRGEQVGTSCAITPCFRLENQYDSLHHGYFMKLELYEPDASKQNLDRVIADALEFFSCHCLSRVVQTGESMYDIVDGNEVELGSYGFREASGNHFIYGTGVALPRLSTAISQVVERGRTE